MMKRIGNYLAGLCLLLACGLASAGERPFDQAAFDQLQAQGKPVVVYFHATWCPTCKIQQPIVDKLTASPALRDVTLFEADYDKEVALKRALHVTQPSGEETNLGAKLIDRLRLRLRRRARMRVAVRLAAVLADADHGSTDAMSPRLVGL